MRNDDDADAYCWSVLVSRSSAYRRSRSRPASSGLASNAEIQKILAERVDTYRQSVGVVVGVIEPSGRRIVTYGRTSANATTPLNGDTLFEIGSMSKVFTSLLLAEAVQRGEVALTDPISKYLPASVKVPERGRAITLQDLSDAQFGFAAHAGQHEARGIRRTRSLTTRWTSSISFSRPIS